MPAVSKKQQRFFGMVRQAQKEGQAKAASPEIARVAASIKKKDAKDFASTEHKGLPEKKVASEGVVDAIKKIKLNKTKVKKSPYSGRDAGAIAAKVMKQKQHNKYVNFLPMDEALDQKDKPFVKNLVKKLKSGSKTHAKQADDLEKAMNEGSLRSWFKGSKSKDGKPGWVNVKTGGTCASDEPGEGTPKCVSSSKRASMSKSERESASRRKKAADPGQQSKSGAAKPTYVSTDSPRKKKMKEEISLTEVKDKKGKGSGTKDACYTKVKSRYSVWPSAYASGALVKCRKVGAANWGNSSKKEEFEPTSISLQQFQEKCWKGYKKKGMKTMFGKRYPNCVKEEETLDEKCWDTHKQVGMKKKGGKMVPNCVPKNEEVIPEAKYETGASTYGKASIRNKRKFGTKGENPDPLTGKKITKDATRGELIDKRREEHKAKRGMKEEVVEVDEMFGVSSSGGRADRGDEVGRKERVKQAQAAKAKRTAVKNTPISKYQGSPSYQRMMAKMKKEEVKRDEYGDPIGGPKISKKQLKKNLITNTPDEQHTTTTSEAASWTKKSGKNPSGGLNEKGRKSYERENPGSDLKRPSKKVGNKRRASFCARMKGMKKKLTSAKTARDPDSRINKSLRAWNC